MQCSKCHGQLVGPSYRNEGGHEHLLYVCSTCGYRDRQPTLDQHEKIADAASKKSLQELMERLEREQIAKVPNINIHWQADGTPFCPSHTRFC